MMNKFPKKGFGMLEIIVGTAIISLSLFVLLGVTRNALVLSRETSRSIRAAFLMEEGLEGVRIIRDRAWSNLSSLTVGTDYYLYWNGTAWTSTTTPQTIDDIYTRTFKLSNVYRDASDDIAASGTLDPDTKKVDVSISWLTHSGATHSEEAAMYLTNFFNE